jgi:hypothetical protein
LFRLFLVAVLAVSGVVSFRLPTEWTQQASRIEAPDDAERSLASVVGDDAPASGITGDLAAPVENSVRVLREGAEHRLEWTWEQGSLSGHVETPERARAPPRVDGRNERT